MDKIREIRERFVQDISTTAQYHRDVGYLLGMMDIATARADAAIEENAAGQNILDMTNEELDNSYKHIEELEVKLTAETARADGLERQVDKIRKIINESSVVTVDHSGEGVIVAVEGDHQVLLRIQQALQDKADG